MSVMFVVMKIFYTRQDTRDFWQESYTTCMDKLMRAEAAQRKLKKHVRKLRSMCASTKRQQVRLYGKLIKHM